jgi:hypothetical protein
MIKLVESSEKTGADADSDPPSFTVKGNIRQQMIGR